MKRNQLLLLKIITLIVIFIVPSNLFISNPEKHDLTNQLRSCLGMKLLNRAEKIYWEILEKNPMNMDTNYQFINFLLRSNQTSKNNHKILREYYLNLTKSNNLKKKDLGFYGLGLIESAEKEDWNKALAFFMEVKNQDLKYLNNSIGFCFMQLNLLDEASKFFAHEISLNGNIEGAYRNLIRIEIKKQNMENLTKMVEMKNEMTKYIPSSYLKKIYLKEKSYYSYIHHTVKASFSSFNWMGFIGAFLILLVWIIYIKKLDIFEPEKFRYLIMILALGMIFAILCHFIYDYYNLKLNFNINRNILNDFLFCIFGIGLIEESVKFIPLLIMIKLSNQVNETIDYIIYASISALGFAFMENLLYFHELNLTIIHSRAFSSTLLHMSLSSIAAYGFVKMIETKKLLKKYLIVFGYFSLAVAIHGLYDFFLIGKGWVTKTKGFSFIILLLSILAFQRIISNSLNNSKFWQDEAKNKFLSLSEYLAIGLTSILILEYLLLSLKYGPYYVNLGFVSSIFSSFLFIYILVGELGYIPLLKGKWSPLFRKEKKSKKMP